MRGWTVAGCLIRIAESAFSFFNGFRVAMGNVDAMPVGDVSTAEGGCRERARRGAARSQ